jgi:hypothetical protein
MLKHLTPARKRVETERTDPLFNIGTAGVQVGLDHIAAVRSHDFADEGAQDREMLRREAATDFPLRMLGDHFANDIDSPPQAPVY